MTTSNHAQADFTAEDQILELTEDQLEAVEGGGMWVNNGLLKFARVMFTSNMATENCHALCASSGVSSSSTIIDATFGGHNPARGSIAGPSARPPAASARRAAARRAPARRSYFEE